jgi:hypothetical protein
MCVVIISLCGIPDQKPQLLFSLFVSRFQQLHRESSDGGLISEGGAPALCFTLLDTPAAGTENKLPVVFIKLLTYKF